MFPGKYRSRRSNISASREAICIKRDHLGVGRVTRNPLTQINNSPVSTRTNNGERMYSNSSQLPSINRQASHFARAGTARCSRQAANIGAKGE